MKQAPRRFAATSRAELRQWIVAGGLALALHAAAVATLLADHGKANSDENFGAMAIEIGVADAAPSFDATDEPTDSGATSAVASAAANETSAVKPEPESAAIAENSEAEQQATPPREQIEQPEKKEAEVKAAAAVAPSTSGAAPSRASEQESAQSVAAAIGSSAEAQRVQAAWRRGLVAHIERKKRAPANGAERSADIIVSFTMDRQGKVTAVKIAKGSGDARFDQAALEMIRRADPLPAPPSVVADQNLSFRLPISFRSGD
jgi:TonB family protein